MIQNLFFKGEEQEVGQSFY